MVLLEQKEICNGCHACAQVCPLSCILMQEDAEGFLYPQIDAEKCVDCGACKSACPVLKPVVTHGETAAYASVNTDETVRKQSSSGGVFTALAEAVLEQGGVVFGAGYTESMSVCHIYIESKNDLNLLRGAKYVQSKIGDAYSTAKRFLDQKRVVFFSGTPCQIAGLKAYLAKDYDNLICQDLICHGVPSPMVWRNYLEFRETKAGAKACRISFREKKHGWKNYSVFFDFENDTHYEKQFINDSFMKAFLSDLSLRPSCYQCRFKSVNRQADITLADFWGIESVAPEFYDNKGTSLVLIHSKTGAKLWQTVQKHLLCKSISPEAAVQHNPSAYTACRMPNERTRFMEEIKTGDFSSVVRKYTKQGFVTASVNFFKQAIKRLLNL